MSVMYFDDTPTAEEIAAQRRWRVQRSRLLTGRVRTVGVLPETLWMLWATGTDEARDLMFEEFGDQLLRTCRHIALEGTREPVSGARNCGDPPGFDEPLDEDGRIRRAPGTVAGTGRDRRGTVR